jgi:hypothetical protein
MTQEEFKTLRKGHTLVSPLGGHLTIAEVKQNAKGETIEVVIMWTDYTITKENCENFEVKK